MQAIQRISTKFTEAITVYADTDRREVVLRDAQGRTHRLTSEQADELRHALYDACLSGGLWA